MAATVKKARATAKKARKQVCGNCEKRGHNARTCEAPKRKGKEKKR